MKLKDKSAIVTGAASVATGALSVLFEHRTAAASAQDRHLSTAGLHSCADATVEIIQPTAIRNCLRIHCPVRLPP
jgi:hypothetical protein